MNLSRKTQVVSRPSQKQGMTLLELTVVILVLLSLISILFIGTKAWRRGADRSGCVMNIRNIQVAVRGFQNSNGYGQGETLKGPDAGKDLLELINSEGYIGSNLYQVAKGAVTCPGSGTCECIVTAAFPLYGDLFMNCSLAISEQHAPAYHTDW